MTRSISDIRAQITSNDAGVLVQSRDFLKGRLAQEEERSKSAQSRATGMIAILGILGGLVVRQNDGIAAIAGENRWFLLSLFAFTLLFLLKGVFAATRALWTTKQKRVRADTVFDFQQGTAIDALREEVTALLWESDHSSVTASLKLFHLNHCQRSAVLSLLLLVLLGLAFLVLREQWLDVPLCVTIAFSTVCGVLLLVGDYAFDRLAGWKHEE